MTQLHQKKLPVLLRHLDELKIERLPLQPHTAVACDNHAREVYATLLAALLLTGEHISADESRLFSMLLAAMELGDIQARLFERAQALDKGTLREFFRVMDENSLAHSFFMDALILLRLDGPLGEAQHQLLAEFAELLPLPDEDIAVLADLAAVVLGLPYKSETPQGFDYAKVSVWGEFLYRTLTVERLKAGVLSGWWQVTESLETVGGWTMENAWLRFSENGSLTTSLNNDDDAVNITASNFDTPRMVFKGLKKDGGEGTGKVSIANTTIAGHYPELEGCTALRFDSVLKSNFDKLNVATRNARSFLLRKTESIFGGCVFDGCGNPLRLGGAIASYGSKSRSWFSIPYEIKIWNCTFNYCRASLGGGIRAEGLGARALENCTFEGCRSIEFTPSDISSEIETYAFGGGAIFVDKISPDENYSSLISCKFIDTSVSIRCSGETSSSRGLFNNCSFKNSYLALCNDRYSSSSGCDFNNGKNSFTSRVIERDKEEWWSDYQ